MAAFVIYSFGNQNFERYFDYIPDLKDDEVLIYTDEEEIQNDDINFWREKAVAKLSLDKYKAMKRAEIAGKRYESEIQGIEINGAKFETDRESQARITSIALQTVVNPKYACRWKTKDGFMIVNANQIMTVAKAVREHVQSCFDQEAVLAKQINDSTSFEELNKIEWDDKPIMDGGFADNTVTDWEYSTRN